MTRDESVTAPARASTESVLGGGAALQFQPVGYDLHITRADNWPHSAENPIAEVEWLALVHSDPTLHVEPRDHLRLRDPDTGALRVLHPVIWVGPDGDDVPFWYDKGEITTKNPSEATVAKMKALAKQLRARVLGDDDEEY
jgi:hypothetical protein